MNPDLIAQVRDAIWDALEKYIALGYVDRDRSIINTSLPGGLDMDKVAEAAILALGVDLETLTLPVFVEDVPRRLIENMTFADGQEHVAKHIEWIPHTRLVSRWFGPDCPDCQGEFGVHDRRRAELLAAMEQH